MSSSNAEGVAILGAGLAGLGCANAVPGARVFEAQSHPGGHAYSHDLHGVHFDEGAHISHTRNTDFLEMIYKQAGEVNCLEPSVVRNVWKGEWMPYPVQNNLRELPEALRVSALTDLIMAHVGQGAEAPANYNEWCQRQYGATLTETFYEAFTRKYWRRETQELATDWLGGRLIPSDLPNIISGAFSDKVKRQAVFKKFHYPAKGGFFAFFKPLYDALDVRYDARVRSIDLRTHLLEFESGASTSFESVASSIPLPTLIRLIKDVPAPVREAAELLHHTKLLCVNMVVSKSSLTNAHWCYIYDEDVQAARVSFPSNLAPGSAPEGCATLQAEIFRDHREDWNVEQLTQATVKDMARLLTFDPKHDVVAVHGVPVSHAYVISDQQRAGAVAQIMEWLEAQHIVSMGLYGKWHYVWSDVAYRSGADAGQALKERL
jgi:protoporphyrinogen oxidase